MTTADGRSGSTVGKYRLHEVVGRGGMGVVYRAEHVYIGREVAVKILHEGYGGREESIKRFLREARAASLINHPNIVEVTDFGKANDGTVFFVMELLVGEPLDAILARERRLDLLRSIIICNQLTAALAAAHSKGIIHRDLKPENVMLIPREGRRELVRRVADESGAYELSEREKQFDFVKILDFGVAKVREPDTQKSRVTKAGVVFGTPEYMAPETARVGYSDARSDIYALGIMFYEMMTGIVPFTGDSPVEVMMKQVNERVPPMRKVTPEAEITEDAERMILKALAKDPDQRHQSMEEFHRDLQKCYGQLRFRRTLRTPSVHQINTPPVTTIPLTRKKKPATPVGLGGVIGVGGTSSGEIPSTVTRPRRVTPRLPGLPVNAAAPILLTKKKTQRPTVEQAADAGSRELEAHRQLYSAANADADSDGGDSVAGGAADDPPVSADAITRKIPEFDLSARAYFAQAADLQNPLSDGRGEIRAAGTFGEAPPRKDHDEGREEKKKRTTLPLGVNQRSERESPAVTVATTIAEPLAAPARKRPAEKDNHRPDLNDPDRRHLDGFARLDSVNPGSGSASGDGVDIQPAMIALPGLPREVSGSAGPDRTTPRVSVASGGDADERSWLDEPTSPALPEYPQYPGKAGKTG